MTLILNHECCFLGKNCGFVIRSICFFAFSVFPTRIWFKAKIMFSFLKKEKMIIAVTIRKEIPQPQCPVAKSQMLKAKAVTARAIRSINPVIFFIFNFPPFLSTLLVGGGIKGGDYFFKVLICSKKFVIPLTPIKGEITINFNLSTHFKLSLCTSTQSR